MEAPADVLDEIRQLYTYNSWANRRCLDAVRHLDSDEFNRDLGSSFPSVRATLEHVLSAEWIWLARWRGVSPTAIPREWDTASLASLASHWDAVDREVHAFLASLSESALSTVIEYRTFAGTPCVNPLWELMRHVVNHSTYHRGQIATMLRQLGHKAPATDLIVWLREQALRADADASATRAHLS
jgi:uncharacterized damage-inducible protein DinB